jgi:hypothetical protein
MEEDHLDCTGRLRRFRLFRYAAGMFVQAVELSDGEPVGLRIVLPVDGDLPPWGELRDRIRARLATRDLARDPRTGELALLTRLVRAQLHDLDSREPAASPRLVIDGMDVTWEELGRALRSLAGFGLRIEIHDPGAE